MTGTAINQVIARGKQ